ncbi:MAG: peptide ABC transporter substrate-binding protein [Proteobacteria bacterium]|nr:peptide ABC transporter substrate-binding protein [Pseudomonadota bacterium]
MTPIRRTCLVVLWLLVVACGTENVGQSDSTLHRGLGTDPESLDAQKARSVQAANLLRDIGEGLLAYSADGKLVPAAAERWEIADDGLTYTFTIRADARWSNGDPLTATHFVLGLRRLVNPANAAFYANTITDIVNAEAIIASDMSADELGVAAIDAQTLRIELTQPVPYLLSLLTHPSTFPAHSKLGNVDTANSARSLLSNGAYKLLSWEPGSLLRLQRNEHYWNNAATAIDLVHYHVIVEETVELNRYRAGELHTTDNVPPENFAAIKEERGDELRISQYLGTYYFGFNLTRPPFKNNPHLRQALSMAVDRDVLVEKITGRGESAAYSWVPPGTDNYAPPQLSYTNLEQEERNAIARSLYHQAGYSDDNPVQVELRYNTSNTQRRIALAVQAMWREALGFEATLVGEEFQVLLTNIREAQITEIFRGSWIGDYNDAATFLNLLLSNNPANMMGYASEEYDSLMQRAAAQVEPRRRRLYLEEAERALLADHAIMPVYFYVSKHLVRPEVRGWEDNVLDYHYSQHLSLDVAQ